MFIRTNAFALHAVTNKIIRTNAVRVIFSIRPDVRKHITISAVVCSYERVQIHSYKFIPTSVRAP